jgi:hypothetical protein
MPGGRLPDGLGPPGRDRGAERNSAASPMVPTKTEPPWHGPEFTGAATVATRPALRVRQGRVGQPRCGADTRYDDPSTGCLGHKPSPATHAVSRAATIATRAADRCEHGLGRIGFWSSMVLPGRNYRRWARWAVGAPRALAARAVERRAPCAAGAVGGARRERYDQPRRPAAAAKARRAMTPAIAERYSRSAWISEATRWPVAISPTAAAGGLPAAISRSTSMAR